MNNSVVARNPGNSALLLIGLALLLSTAQPANAQITYAIGADSRGGQVCGTVDLASGHWSILASSLAPSLAGIGQFGSNLYGGTYGGSGLYEVNPVNCVYIPISLSNGNLAYGSFGSTTGTTAALYGIAGGYLYVVHANNGSTMLIGPTNLNTTSLSANCPVLYTTATQSNGNSALYSINTNTGAASEIGDTGVSNITAMVCANDQLYGAKYNGQLCTLNLANGMASCQLDTEPFLVGMAYPPSPPPTFSVLHTFTGGADGAQPWGGMITDPAGNLYGTAGAGGSAPCSYLGATGCGTLFQLKKHNTSYTFNPLYSFQGGADGEFPARPLTLGPNGTFYGTTTGGGEGTCSFYGVSGCGLVFNAGPTAQPPRTPLLQFRENALYRFTGGSDGGNPFSTLIFDQAGNMYGTTAVGGTHGLGTVFELTPAGGGTYTETVLYSFAGGTDGVNPFDGVVFDTAGNLYGTTLYGGGSSVCQYGCGTVFKLSPNSGGWTETVLYRFQGTNDGNYPAAGVAIDSAGNLYGNTNQAGTGQGGIGATVYELSPNGSNWTYNLLYAPLYYDGGGFGYGRVVLDASGNLYGALQAGGAFGHGQVFELTHGSWIYTDLYDFTDGVDGASPYSGVTLDSSGNVYGTTLIGGGAGCNRGCGVVWEITP